MRPAAPDLLGQIERYLLGRLPDRERDRIEALVFEDEEVWSTLRDAEDDLIERYVANALSAEERRDFEQHFAISSSRRERIGFARALPQALRSLPSERPRSTFRPWLGVAAALVVTAFWLGREKWSAPASPVASPAPLRAARTPVASGSLPLTTPAPAPDVPALVLRGPLLRSAAHRGIARLDLPLPESIVRIDVELDRPAASSIHVATLRTVEGTELWRGAASIHSGRRTASVVLPASILRAGDYLLRVTGGDAGGDSTSDGAEYPFRVRVGPQAARP